MSRFKQAKPKDPHVILAEVVRTERVTPNMVRVTFGGESLRLFEPLGHDQWFRLFLPRAGQQALRLPTRSSVLWYAQFLRMPKDQRPYVRNYTVRAFRPAGAALAHPELDVDFVVHGSGSGPASDWAASAAPGDTAGILDQGVAYPPAHEPAWHLIAVDETGLPAAAGILASLPRDARGHAFVELPNAADAQHLDAPAGVEVHWLPRAADAGAGAGAGASHDHVPGRLALEAASALTLPEGRGYAYLAGESALATGLRRHLVAQGMAKSDISFVGYWRVGHAAAG
ncbi:siderophore-interacting protein [Herbiconiux sp. CPCC 203407]|uniref:Siderophore-interacting protein n=1 Tax=Herbiconiux oxytropis TaxID=2970915 RepID=A0AA41XHW9_9MICO|nr:siderophore-interacting protein [Herbiconiux oxytropis]MCS5724007.1 siderophore-interacting protein [Herbiconiux oxytropis]MCS5726585.1 siderophore-interacting protein [Herbiconiux oxytropis]